MVLTIVVTCNSTNKSCQLQQCIQKLSFAIFAYKSCHLLLLHTKVIAALTQFCDFYWSRAKNVPVSDWTNSKETPHWLTQFSYQLEIDVSIKTSFPEVT